MVKEENNENEEITEVMYGIDNTINRGVQFMQNASEKMDLFGEKNGPSIIIEFPDIYKNNYIAAKKRGVKIRFITEITKENIHYCKKILNIVTEMRHLEGLIGGIAVTEKEYMATTSLKNKQLLTQVFYSNAFEVVRQGQYIFDTFWDKAIPAGQRIKEIEEGIEPIKTKILENQNEIYNHLKKSIENSTERYVCSSIGGMDLVYNNFFNLYKEIIERQKRGEGNGIICAQKPVVTNRVGEVAAILQNQGCYYTYGDLSSLSAAVASALTLKPRYELEKLSWRERAESYVTFLESAVLPVRPSQAS